MKPTRSPKSQLRTEQSNHAAHDLDQKSSLEIAHLINAEDTKIARSVSRALAQIARAIDLVVAALHRGGRLIYVGAGTSGRIAALDAVEIPPTFNFHRVLFRIAGGAKALASASEISEDNEPAGRKEIARLKPTKKDGSSASPPVDALPSPSPPSPKRAAAARALSLSPAIPIPCSNAPRISPSSSKSAPKFSPDRRA